jgi:CelD/BcsL family acetyltransferase involved in cellulose biosynthesis/glycosyltransferase involved in cell wall biosynthesis
MWVASEHERDLVRRPEPASRALIVVSVAYPLAPVGADAVGGAEQVLASLDRALVEHGHRSIVIACAGSSVEGELIEVPAPGARIDARAHWVAHGACRAAIRDVLAREPVDLVHMHGIDFHAYLPPPGPPVLATLHMPIASYPPDVFHLARPRTFLHGVSHAQARQCPEGHAAVLPPITNGVDLDVLRPRASPREDAVVLGRICREKGQHLALEAASRAHVSLVLAGKVFAFDDHERYFAEEIVPRLDDRRRFVGPVTGGRKVRLLAGARCLVVPSVIEETSSLVAMEALACGTPVVAFRRGALAELVEHGVTGFLVDGVTELAAALRAVSSLDRARCRAAAEQRCARERMCVEYLRRYALIVETAECAGPAGSSRASRTSRTIEAGGASRTGPVEVRTVDRAALAALVPAWSALWDRCPEATVFQHPDWALPWCNHLLQGTVEAVCAWCDGVLVGLLPLFRWRDGAAEVLSLIGAGVSDYLDALVDPGCDGVHRALEEALGRARWDRLELSELADGSRLLELGAGTGEMRLVIAQEPCPALELDAAAPGHGVPAGVQRELGYQHRRAGRDGTGISVGPRVVPPDPVAALAALHGARWSARGQDGALAATPQHAFLTEAVDRLAARDALLVVGVRFGGELAAIALGFFDRGVARYYLGGFDPRHRARSPGTLAVAALVDEAARRGARVFDFLRGTEPYKYRFGARDRVRLHRLVVTRTRG